MTFDTIACTIASLKPNSSLSNLGFYWSLLINPSPFFSQRFLLVINSPHVYVKRSRGNEWSDISGKETSACDLAVLGFVVSVSLRLSINLVKRFFHRENRRYRYPREIRARQRRLRKRNERALEISRHASIFKHDGADLSSSPLLYLMKLRDISSSVLAGWTSRSNEKRPQLDGADKGRAKGAINLGRTEIVTT